MDKVLAGGAGVGVGASGAVDEGESDIRLFRLDRLCGLPTERAIKITHD